MSLKKFVAPALHSLGAWSGMSLRKGKSMSVGRIIMFHGVGDSIYSEKEFESNLRYLAKHFSIISLEQFAQALESRQQLKDEIALTFDDGLRNNLTSAYPILKRLNLPATFFVCPALIEKNRWLWNQEARARLLSLPLERRNGLLARIRPQCRADVEEFVGWMKTIRLDEREAVEERIRNESSSFRPTARQRQEYDVMNWEELRSLDPDVITVGSHSVNHPILSTLEPGDLRFEVVESRRILEEKLGRKVDQFCYPNGAYNAAAVEEVRKSYRIAVIVKYGFVDGSEDIMQLPRMGIAPQPLLSWRLHRPRA